MKKLSRRAQQALDTLQNELGGQQASSLAAIEKALTGHDGSADDTPGRRRGRELAAEGKERFAKRPPEDTKDSDSPAKGESNSGPEKKDGGGNPFAKQSTSAKAPNSFRDALKRRRGTAKKG